MSMFRLFVCLGCLTLLAQLDLASFEGEIKAPIEILDSRKFLNATVWKDEVAMRPYEEFVTTFQDELREADNGLDVLGGYVWGKVEKPQLVRRRKLPERVFEFVHDIGGSSRSYLISSLFARRIEEFVAAGYVLEQSDWQLVSMETNEDGQAVTGIEFDLHVVGPSETLYRRIFRGTLNILWRTELSEEGAVIPEQIEIDSLLMLRRSGVLGFKKTSWLESDDMNPPYGLILVEDIDGDGLLDVLFPNHNILYRNKGGMRFDPNQFVAHRIEGRVGNALFADLDLDGNLEYVVAIGGKKLYAYEKSEKTGRYDRKPVTIWKAPDLMLSKSLSAGDLDGDGRPELFLGQYSFGYGSRDIPNPIHNDNSSRPSYLLRNKGGLKYEEVPSRLSKEVKMNRRTNMVGMVDLNRDGRLDLLVAGDFSGLDLYENTEDGTMIDRLDDWLGGERSFGRGYVVNDFNRDGVMDLFVPGLFSEEVRRMNMYGYSRDGFEELEALRRVTAGGNRLYYGKGDGSFELSEYSDQIADSGYASGVGAFDFNNDGYDDIFVVNGFMSTETAVDYDLEFWRHAAYEGSFVDPDILAWFGSLLGPMTKIQKGALSWHPFELDNLFFNVGGEEYVDYGYLMGVTSDGDGRIVLTEDFDNDGRVDILMTEIATIDHNQTVTLYRNQQVSQGSWIGIDLAPIAGKSIIGARVRVIAEHFEVEKVYMLGGRLTAQPSSRLHFGLGEIDDLIALEIVWPDGEVTRLASPKLGKYHKVSPSLN